MSRVAEPEGREDILSDQGRRLLERLKLAAGELVIDSKSGSGTTVVAHVPL